MRTSFLAALVSVCAIVMAVDAAAQDYDRYRDAVVVCESKDGRSRECAADVRGNVRLLRQLSRSACVEDRTWGATPGGVWVTGGCRGEFLVSGRYRARGPAESRQFLRCESKDGRSNHCPAATEGGVELVRQLSRSPCIRGQSWGWNERGVWVSGGCRAEFRSLVEQHDDDVGPVEVTRCESRSGAPTHCPADTRGDVRLLRQLSRSPCVESRSWGYDRLGVWVDAGCRAEFEVTGPASSGWARGDR